MPVREPPARESRTLLLRAGRDALSVTREVEEWIEGEMRTLNPERYAGS